MAQIIRSTQDFFISRRELLIQLTIGTWRQVLMGLVQKSAYSFLGEEIALAEVCDCGRSVPLAVAGFFRDRLDAYLATYIYETTDPDRPVRHFELQQSMKDAPLTI